MKRMLIPAFLVVLLLATGPVYAQQRIFHHEIQANFSTYGAITGMVQDRQGYIWFGCTIQGGGKGGLHRYDGQGRSTLYLHDPKDTNSLGNNWVETLCIDSSGMIWIGTHGAGLDRFNPVTKTFTHFSYDPDDPSGIANDSVNALLIDHLGNLWVGTNQGLDLFSRATGKFTHYTCNPGSASTISDNKVRILYEDHEGNLWVGCGSPFPGSGDAPEAGGLNLFNRAKGTFTRYLHNRHDPKSISNNKITAIDEDSRGNLWIGTGGNGLQTLNSKTGVFTHYPYDPDHPEKFSAPPLIKNAPPYVNIITFIQEDAAGNLWIGSPYQGIKQYDPETKKITHYGYLWQQPDKLIPADTASGYVTHWTWRAFNSKNGLLWICGNANLYYVNPFQKNIPYYRLKQPSANAFYKDDKGALWIATDAGLLYKPVQGKEKLFVHDPKNPNSLAGNAIAIMLPDKEGNLWLGTYPGAGVSTANGLDKFDPATGTFTHYSDSGMLKGNGITALCFDDSGQSLWIGTSGGLYKLNTRTGKFIHHYVSHIKDSNSLGSNIIYYVAVYGSRLWAGTTKGLDLLNKKTGQWKHYLTVSTILGIYKDAAGVLWVGTSNGLYRYDQQKDHFLRYMDTATGINPQKVLNIIEDNSHHLWVSGTDVIYRISANRDTLSVLGPQYGVHPNTFLLAINYKAENGELFLGDQGGYYAFNPDSFGIRMIPPMLNITGFQLGNKKIMPGPGSPLKAPVFEAKKINLNHKQNSFSFSFTALHYSSPGDEQYRYMLQNYDNTWHDIGDLRKAYFFSIPPGHYIFKVRAVNSNGAWNEKDVAVIISPPWWTTWWAIVIFILILIAIIWGIVYYRSRQLRRENRLLEEKVNHRTEQLKQSLDNLKSAQKQLIQSEKMASLGELTAGIAHEIQNPLNFVNNFSEVNRELINELKEEWKKEKRDPENEYEILNNIDENEQKINHHGKRADAIVKSMLQHSRTSIGQKEPTDMNALADEYLRLSYHGLRAKDKSFNAKMETNFDSSVPKINMIPQDIGRVLLNLFNNAFYSVNEKKKASSPSGELPYEPVVSVTTRKEGDGVSIAVKDNGNGIPHEVLDKIYQPFFTTKPTGEGTGLGLSLSYDIIKAHGGTLKTDTKQGEFAEFIIFLPDGYTT